MASTTAYPCPECKDYYAVHGEYVQESCRHRKRECRTPPGFWDLDFSDEPIPVEGRMSPPPRRNRYDVPEKKKAKCRPLPLKRGWTRVIKDDPLWWQKPIECDP
ncbi:hypothetical protein JTE90_022658 [Oedothorax gibbosus]|uniref:DNA endonuclease activator Ctp1 C-terminal domain-containing protein n=1 Tax=Oedothorax gibbosus TaxID=931172 RepID=A0AAV6TN83_9ARAC|nr:hypothetical protein JTE90_014811 [Oedothorax gibbosus]KAG8173227.1 hypothetical protein JTE90_023702 [Oedothorax gibbosus]KAG8175235.1 hypothetical protein JTE90_022658 [Oedothorax gibbosus]